MMDARILSRPRSQTISQFHRTTRWLMLVSTPEVQHMRHATIIGLLIGCVLVTATLSAQVGRLPDQITDQEFWRTVTEFSESTGPYTGDNWISNEASIQ